MQKKIAAAATGGTISSSPKQMEVPVQNIPALENRMRKTVAILAFVLLALVVLPQVTQQARAQADPYPVMAPLEAYLMPQEAEIALARSAAPPSIADGATVMVLGREGYTTAVQGKNGFLCYVERSWAKTTDDPEFWNPKVRAPNCFNAPAARSVAQIYLMKTRLVLAGKSKAEIVQALAAAPDHKKLPALEPGGMCYMMSKQQYLNDQGRSWRAHLMFYVAGDVANSWGANLPGSPVIAFNDPEAQVTTFIVVVGHWSDGTPAPH
ncbi:MAG TPA: hypothetical protein VHX49_05120 [Candidatus Acidoferrales bacterium]|nr:hypothetical protein [Candidatus Acidoferrales bacterium]